MVDDFLRTKDQIAPSLNKVELLGQFVVWLTIKRAEFAKGRIAFAKWAVENLVRTRKSLRGVGNLRLYSCVFYELL